MGAMENEYLLKSTFQRSAESFLINTGECAFVSLDHLVATAVQPAAKD